MKLVQRIHLDRAGAGRLPALALLSVLALLAMSLSGLRPALASHYLIEDLPPLTQVERSGLAQLSVRSTDELLTQVATPELRKQLQDRLRTHEVTVDIKRLQRWAMWVDLLQLKGVGPTMVRLMLEAGITGTRDLAGRQPAALTELLAQTNARTSIAGKIPCEQHLKSWISAAARVPVTVR